MSTQTDHQSNKSDRHNCAATVRSGWHNTGCIKPATVERDGVWYCGIHDPVRVSARRDRQRQKDAEREAISVRNLADGTRILETLGIKGRVDFDRDHENGGWGRLRRLVIDFEEAEKLIAKAEGR